MDVPRNVPQLSGELAKRIYPDGRPVDLVDGIKRYSAIAADAGCLDFAVEIAVASFGLLDFKMDALSRPSTVEYLQWADIPASVTRDDLHYHIDDILGAQGFSKIHEPVFDPARLYKKDGSNDVYRVDVTFSSQNLFVTVSDETEFYANYEGASRTSL